MKNRIHNGCRFHCPNPARSMTGTETFFGRIPSCVHACTRKHVYIVFRPEPLFGCLPDSRYLPRTEKWNPPPMILQCCQPPCLLCSAVPEVIRYRRTLRSYTYMIIRIWSKGVYDKHRSPFFGIPTWYTLLRAKPRFKW